MNIDNATAKAQADEIRKKMLGLNYDIRLIDPMDFRTIPHVKTEDIGKRTR